MTDTLELLRAHADFLRKQLREVEDQIQAEEPDPFEDWPQEDGWYETKDGFIARRQTSERYGPEWDDGWGNSLSDYNSEADKPIYRLVREGFE